MTLTTSTESDLLRSPPDEVVEAPLPKVRFFLSISAKPSYPWGTTNQIVSHQI